MTLHHNRLAFLPGIKKVLFALALVFCFQPAWAQQHIDNRYLFIFDTSSAMKKRLLSVTNEIDDLFVSSMHGQFQDGDTIGVWMFSRDLRTGELPLQRWMPGMASQIAGNINSALIKQSFSKNTRFSVLEPYLDEVVRHSQRLTVLIFTDGEGEFKGSPYDDDINAVFKQKAAAQKEAQRPFILVFRSQNGQFIGATIGIPPGSLNMPAFPPLPVPLETSEQSSPLPTNQPSAPKVPVPVPLAPSMIIIGTNVSTNLPPASMQSRPSATSQAIQTVTPLPTVAHITNVTTITNYVTVMVKSSPPPEIPSSPTPGSVISTEPVGAISPELGAPVKSSGAGVVPVHLDSTGKMLAVGGALLLVVAGGLTMLLIGRSHRRDRASLITQTLNKKQ